MYLGIPDLLRQCCDAGVEFSESDDLTNIPYIAPFVVLHGCQIEEMEFEYKGVIKTQPFAHHEKYMDYTLERQQKAMDEWVAEHVCPLFPEPKHACLGGRRMSEKNALEMDCDPLPEQPEAHNDGDGAVGGPSPASSAGTGLGEAVGTPDSTSSGGDPGPLEAPPGGDSGDDAPLPGDEDNVSSAVRYDLSDIGFIIFFCCVYKMF